ncbi:MAG: hypothetical protein CMJ25_04985 [Phycisphaerae bacterium]|nr:hypothetical protein [Phycisphaerae bacterium]|tara:strand:+ start:326 stop:634 length:309 start_codon:yes stop_codon:yes gene_type:complete
MATWTISTLEHNTADGGVIVAHWRVNDSETVGEETYSASAYSTCSFTPDASAPDYVPYADLTEEMVLGWCFDGDVDKDAIEASLTAQIEEQKNPTTEDGVPW